MWFGAEREVKQMVTYKPTRPWGRCGWLVLAALWLAAWTQAAVAVPDFAPRRMTLDAELNLVYLAQNVDTDPARRSIAATESAEIGVLYPDIAEPYRSVFTKIVAGI